MAEYAAFILISPQDEFILQLRDDNPNIADPNKLSLFAGRVEDGETVEQAAVRELEEETTLPPDGMELLGDFQKDAERHGAPGVCHIFTMEDVDPARLDVREGQGYRLLAQADFIHAKEEDFARISYDILAWFLQNKQRA